MQTYVLLSALAIALPATTQQLVAAEIPVKQIILYKHGIGYFEREGVVAAGEEARLDFKTSDMNDVLKSLTVADGSGGRISGVRYDSNETLDQRLDRYPFRVGSQERLSAFLDSIKGAHIELKSAEHTVNGAILGARAIEAAGDGDKRVVHEQVTLLGDSGDVANYDLATVSSLRLLDSHLQEQLKQYLQTLAQAQSREKRGVYIDSAGGSSRQLRISYISPTPIWKSSYRLALGGASSTLEGWAIVDNTTGEDWNSVKLSVVSGRPISFISLLDTPRYGRREVAELPEDRAAGPVVYAGSVDALAATPAAGNAKGFLARSGIAGAVGGRLDGTHMGTSAAPAPEALTQFAQLQASSVEGATGAALGELFEYNFANPITIKKNQSAMLPFLQDKVAARKLLIYTERDGEHPVNAAEIVNNTAKTLDGGPITVYDAGAYAGEALFETLKDGDKRLIGYAVDYGTRITTAFDSSQKTIREIHVKDGALQLRYAERQVRNYTIKNVDAKAKALIVQQEGIGQYNVLSPKPVERTATAYRFEVNVPANGSQTLKVEQERTTENLTQVFSSTPNFLAVIVENKELSERGKKQLQGVLDLKRRLAANDASLHTAKSQTSDLTEDQTRLRQNIDSLNRVKGQEEQVRQYSTQLAGNEAQLAKLRDQGRDLALLSSSLNAELRGAIDTLDF
jgi:hypothetical protein